MTSPLERDAVPTVCERSSKWARRVNHQRFEPTLSKVSLSDSTQGLRARSLGISIFSASPAQNIQSDAFDSELIPHRGLDRLAWTLQLPSCANMQSPADVLLLGRTTTTSASDEASIPSFFAVSFLSAYRNGILVLEPHGLTSPSWYQASQFTAQTSCHRLCGRLCRFLPVRRSFMIATRQRAARHDRKFVQEDNGEAMRPD